MTEKPKGDSATRDADARHVLLSQHAPARTRGITDVVVAKDQDVFLVVMRSGHIPHVTHHGCGLYWRDTRFLSRCEFVVNGQSAELLLSEEKGDAELEFQLSQQGGRAKEDERAVGLRWSWRLDGGARRVYIELALRSYAIHPVDLEVHLKLGCDFRDVFEVRGIVDAEERASVEGEWQGNVLTWERTGRDAAERRVEMRFAPAPHVRNVDEARWRVQVGPGAVSVLSAVGTLDDSNVSPTPQTAPTSEPSKQATRTQSPEAWRSLHTAIETDDEFVAQVAQRAIDDMGLLRTPIGDDLFFAAGIPWFATLFGRDSIIAALQTLAWNPATASDTLQLLHRFQGKQIDTWRDEQPGKILHELRRGELAAISAIPHTPYYGTVDATPLFLCLFGRWLAWTDDTAAAAALRPSVEAALSWIDGAVAGDGLIWYGSDQGGGGLANQGWKDSGDAVVNCDGSLATPPIAMVEVQGYVVRAWHEVARYFDRVGEPGRGYTLRARAQGYHVGSVWPHDTAFLAAGLRRYGLDDDAARVCHGLLDAASRLDQSRLPELFCGYTDQEYTRPVPYPVACHPQAWGAGAALSVVHTLLGLCADAPGRRLRVLRPLLPRHAEWLRLRGLRVGPGELDLMFRRTGAAVRVDVERATNGLQVEVETEPAREREEVG